MTSDAVIEKLVRWAEEREDVRVMILTSSRANPRAALDAFSDYDVILIVLDITHYLKNDSWLGDFGDVLTVYHDPVKLEYGFERFIRVTQYEDGTKIDFTLWPMELLRHVAAEPELPANLDIGYLVLLDKDNLGAGLKPATHTTYIPTVPTEEEYQTIVEHFFSNAPYVAKHIRRGDLMALKYCLDQVMKVDYLRLMLEWKIGIAHNWSVRTGSLGGGMGKYLSAEILAELKDTYAGAGDEENWEALFRTIDLFRGVALEVATGLGFSYPQDLDNRMVKYIQKIRVQDS